MSNFIKTSETQAENNSHIIRKSLGCYEFTSKDNYNSRISDARKILKLNERDGFVTIDDCIDYANKYLK